MPLSFVIARYFAYAFAAVATAWLASFMALSAAMNAGFVYEASWGPANAREAAPPPGDGARMTAPGTAVELNVGECAFLRLFGPSKPAGVTFDIRERGANKDSRRTL